ncbi:hypothetical protein SFRURICE_014351 [Spodoptera frugiperda]|nr:hypothetical protein SFRURICE_014351 [Spodoptera frugiperda]
MQAAYDVTKQRAVAGPNKVSNVENEQAVWCQSQSARDIDTARSMRSSLYLVALCALVAARAAPAPDAAPDAAPEPAPQPAAAAAADDRPEIIEIIAPAASAQETLATLNLGAPGSELSERNKRTIGILRQLFPSLTQQLVSPPDGELAGGAARLPCLLDVAANCCVL